MKFTFLLTASIEGNYGCIYQNFGYKIHLEMFRHCLSATVYVLHKHVCFIVLGNNQHWES